MRAGAPLLALLCVTGCSVEWAAQPADPSAMAEVDQPVSPASIGGPLAELRRTLRARLRSVEQELDGFAELDEARSSELREERLLLTVALSVLASWIEAGAQRWGEEQGWGEESPALDVDGLLEIARRRVAEGRQRLADRRQVTRGDFFDLGGAGAGARGGLGLKGPGRAYEVGVDNKPDPKAKLREDLFAPVDSPPPMAPPMAQPEPVPVEEAEDDDDDDEGWAKGGEDEPVQPGPAPAAAAVIADQEPPLDLMPAVRRRKGALLSCFPPAELDHAIHLEVMARLAADGSLRILRVSADRGLTPTTNSCVAEVLAAVRVDPAVHGGSRVVTFPFTLTKD